MPAGRRRFAEWTPGFRGAPPAVGAAYLITFFCVVAAIGIRYLPQAINVLFLPFQFAGAALRLYRPVVRRRVLPLRDLPAAAPQFSVRLTLFQGVAYGSDEGHASFVDGWLVFQGAGCAFSLRAVDAKVSPSGTSLEFDGRCRPHEVTFDYAEKGFKEAWDAWRGGRSSSEGEAILPPVLPLASCGGPNHQAIALLFGVAAFALPFHSAAGLSSLGLIAAAIALLARRARRAKVDRLDRIALGKPARKSAWKILGTDIHLERLGEAIRCDRRRRRRRRALCRKADG